jgi:hypothetical protein
MLGSNSSVRGKKPGLPGLIRYLNSFFPGQNADSQWSYDILFNILNSVLFALFLLVLSFPAQSQVQTAPVLDWSQPPVACLEEIVVQKPSRTCLNLSQVEDPLKEDLSSFPQEEKDFWLNPANSRSLRYCRSVEVLKREDANPGSFTPGAVQVAWMRVSAVHKSDEKLLAISRSSEKFKVPQHILVGALLQESVLADLGIADDGGNFSCGVGQINLVEWCGWANKQSDQIKDEISWPRAGLVCRDLSKELVRPFYEIALTRLNGKPLYRMDSAYFQRISFKDVEAGFPQADTAKKQMWYSVTKAFINNCSKPLLGIEAKAHELSELFRLYVPQGLKDREKYAPGKGLNRTCKNKDTTGYFPHHTGWLMAVAAYNAGPAPAGIFSHYNRWTREQMQTTRVFNGFSPLALVESFYWGGKYDSVTDKINYTTSSGRSLNMGWFKQCIMQRHIARVIQHGTQSGVTPWASSLEGPGGCAKSKVNPVTGEVITTVPEARQVSSGFKN